MTRRQINTPFCTILLLAAVALGVGVHFLHGHQVRRSARGLLELADKAREAGDAARAVRYYRRYLGHAPGDADALARYGQTLERLASTPAGTEELPDARERAFYALEQVLRLEPGRAEVRRTLVDVALGLGQYADALAHLDVLLRDRPRQGDLHHLRGACLEAQLNYRPAAAAYAEAVRCDPALLASYVRLATLYQSRLEQPEQADRALDSLVAANARNPLAHLARAAYRKQSAQLDDAAKSQLLDQAGKDLDEARRLAPDDADVLLASAEVAHAAGKYDQAAAFAERAAARHPGEYRSAILLAEARVRRGQRREALAGLREAAQTYRNRPDALWRLAGILLDLKEPAEARAVLALAQNEAHPTVAYLKARFLVEEEKWLEASRALEAVRPRLRPLPELSAQLSLILAACHGHLGNPDQQLLAYREALALEPNNLTARLGVAAALLAANRADEALEEYRRLAPRSPAAAAQAVRLILARNNRLAPEQRRWAECDLLLEQLARTNPRALDTALTRAEALAARGNVDAARRILDEIRPHHPQEVAPWTALAQLAEGQGDTAAALRILDEAGRILGDNSELRVARIAFWGRRAGPEAGQVLDEIAREVERDVPRDRVPVLHALAGAYYQRGQADRARQLWQQLADGPAKDDLRIRLLLFDLALESGDAATVAAALAPIRALESEDGALWRYAEAARLYLLARQGDAQRVAEARARLGEVATRRPGWSRVPLLEARLDELQGNPDKAVENYLRAIDLGDRQPDVFRRVTQLLYQRRRYQEAEQVLRRLPERAALAAGLGRLAGEVALHNNDPARALEWARRSAPESSRDYRDHLWLGQVYAAAGNPAAAEKAYRRAVELAGKTPDPWVVLVQFLARTGRGVEAEAVIASAERALGPDQAAVAIGQCYESLGQLDLAEQRYQGALRSQAEDFATLQGVAEFYLRTRQFCKAGPVLRQSLGGGVRRKESDTAWARRHLATALVGCEGAVRFAEALELVEQNVRNFGSSPEDQRVKAFVLAVHPARRKEAIRMLEDLGGKQPPTPDEQLLLARLVDLERDWPRARDLMLNLLAARHDEPVYLAAFVEMLLRRGESGEAALWLQRLEKAEPDSFRTVRLRARVHLSQNRAPEAAALLRKHALDHEADLPRAASLLEEWGQEPVAEELYRRRVRPDRPAAALALAVCLARQGRAAQALDVCDQAAGAARPEDLAAAGVNVAYAATLDAGQFARVERWVSAALGQRPNGRSALFCLANLRFVQGRHDDAERVYGQILQKEPRDAAVLNNLAWLLALGRGRHAEALDVVNRAIDAAGPVPDLLDTRAVILVAAGRDADAVKDLEEAIALDPTPPRYFHLAQALHQGKNRGAALDALQQAKRLALRPVGLHPLERATYQRVLAELGGTS